jgi:hypothetical protein
VDIKDRLKKTGQANLMLNIDDKLVHIPWELLYDGKEFLCHRFSVGRSVSTQQAVSVVVRALHRPLKMQILADPRGDLKAAYEEGVAIKNEVASFEDWLDVSLKTTDITTDYAKGKIRNFDIVHYAGHAQHNAEHPEQSGWLLKDGRLSATEIMTMAGSRPMPALVFSNACQTGQTETWKLDEDFSTRIFGVANAFLLSGVQHYIGTFWEIPDEAGALFARSFYRSLVGGATIGEAMRQARIALIQKYGEDTIVWASYMLYGDPTTCYAVLEEAPAVEPSAKKQELEQLATATLRGTDAAIAVPAGRKNRTVLYAGAAVMALVVIVAFLLLGKGRGPSAPAPSAERPAATVQPEVPRSDADARKPRGKVRRSTAPLRRVEQQAGHHGLHGREVGGRRRQGREPALDEGDPGAWGRWPGADGGARAAGQASGRAETKLVGPRGPRDGAQDRQAPVSEDHDHGKHRGREERHGHHAAVHRHRDHSGPEGPDRGRANNRH